MALGVVLTGKGNTEEQYWGVCQRINPGNRLVPGLKFHAAGKTNDGICIVEVWESQEMMGAFFQAGLSQVLADEGVDLQPTFFEIVNVIDEA